MRHPILARLLCFAMSVLILVCSCATVMAADETESDGIKGSKTSLDEIAELLEAVDYDEYLENVSQLAKPAEKEFVFPVTAALDKAESTVDVKTETLTDAETGETVNAVLLPDDGTVAFRLNIPVDGLYAIKAKYYADGSDIGSNSTIERSVRIDGQIPFAEARSIELLRAWKDVFLTEETNSYESTATSAEGKKLYGERNEMFLDDDGIVKYVDRAAMISGDTVMPYPAFKWDKNGNDIRLSKEQISGKFLEKYFMDSTGYVAEPLYFYFTAGEHILSLEAVREEFYLASLILGPAPEVVSYEDYLAANSGKPNNASGKVYIEAEHPTATSDKSIYALNDRSSAITSPQDPSETRLNTIGASKWQEIGQWISYDVDIPADGFYNISLRFVQSTMEGLFTSRKLLIDGVCPFDGASKLRFNYSRKWQLEALSDTEGNAYEFYFTAGKHTISFEVVLGDMASILSRVSDTNAHINEMYLDILMLTGSDPDAYIDYQFIENLPEVVRGLRAESANLYDIADELTETVGQAGSNTATLQKTAYLCKKVGYDTDLIARNLDRLKSDVGTIGTWIQSVSKQPLTLDYILITPAGEDIPKGYKGDANFFEAVGFEFKSFFMSFFTDYTSVGVTRDMDEIDEDDIVEVWYAVDRDRATVIREMIDNDFTPKTGVAVNFKLVAGGSLLPSILAGVGPDVSLQHGSTDIINWSIRGAIQPLNGFDDASKGYIPFSEAIGTFNEETETYQGGWFTEAAITNLTLYAEYEDGTKTHDVYAIPETQNFYMMFYRADILSQLGIKVPETWDDVISMISVLQENNMQIALPTKQAGTDILLYQMGGDLYAENGKRINYDSDVALSAFKMLTKFFTDYSQPKDYSFVNRFRTGEIPVGIVNYTEYTQLSVYATEIRGMWEFVQLPGYIMSYNEDGTRTVNHTSTASVTGNIMVKDDKRTAEKNEDCWRFLAWFSGAETQTNYANELTALLGTESKHNTANVKALESLPWTTQEYKNLTSQFNDKNLSAVREYPGGYIISRYVGFAFLAVYNDGAEPVDAMLGYVTNINAEITRKRQEFGLACAKASSSSSFSDYVEEAK